MKPLHKTIALCGHVSLIELSAILDVSADVLVDDLEILVDSDAVIETLRPGLPTLYRTKEVDERLKAQAEEMQQTKESKATLKNVDLMMLIKKNDLKQFTGNSLTKLSGMSRADVEDAIEKLIGEKLIRVKATKEYMGHPYKIYVTGSKGPVKKSTKGHKSDDDISFD